MSKTKKTKMAKTKTKSARKRSTVDLIVRHSETHIEKRPHLRLWAHLPQTRRAFLSPLLFAFAGVVVMVAAFHLVNSADPAFIAPGATDYEAQKAFYASEEEMHAAASAVSKVHEVAAATELAHVLNSISFLLVLGALWYFYDRRFGENRFGGFRIRRIR